MTKKQDEKPELSKSIRISEVTHEKLIQAQIKIEGVKKKRLTFDEVIDIACEIAQKVDNKKLLAS